MMPNITALPSARSSSIDFLNEKLENITTKFIISKLKLKNDNDLKKLYEAGLLIHLPE